MVFWHTRHQALCATAVGVGLMLACPGLAAADRVVELTGGVTPGFTADAIPEGITVGPDHHIWFTEGDLDHHAIARVNSDGTVTEFPVHFNGSPDQIVSGPDGDLWFTINNYDTSNGPGGIGRLDPSTGAITYLTGGVTSGFSADADPRGITVGPDGNVWFTEAALNNDGGCGQAASLCGGLARVNSNATVSQFTAGHNLPGMTPDAEPGAIAVGPDGNLWFTEPFLTRNGQEVAGIGRLNLGFATVTEFTAAGITGLNTSTGGGLSDITAGAGGDLWFTEGFQDGGIGSITTTGQVTVYDGATSPGFVSGADPTALAQGPDGNMWFTQAGDPGLIGRLNPDGSVTELTGGSTAGFTADAVPQGIVDGPDGHVWFIENHDPGRVAYVLEQPTAVTKPAAGVGVESATLNGTVDPNAGSVSDCHFDYGTTTSYGQSAPCEQTVGAGSQPVGVSVDLGGTQLLPATAYHFRVVATNSGGTDYGADQTFTTSPGLPTATTGQAVSVSLTSATLTGTIDPNGATVTDCHFEYGTSAGSATSVPCSQPVGGGDAPVAVSASVTGLLPVTNYTFRVVATNSVGTSIGGEYVQFTTLLQPSPGAPLVTTGQVTDITPTSATVTGTVNPGDSTASYRFQYGTSKAYGHSVPARVASAGSGVHSVTQRITGLAPATTYHVRILATNGTGTTAGADVTFMTGGSSKPELADLKLSPSRVHPAGRGRQGHHGGTTISYSDSTSATTTLTILRETRGFQASGACVRHAPQRAHVSGRCRLLIVIGQFIHSDQRGMNRVYFGGRLNGRRLEPGAYVLRVTATDQGGASVMESAPFTMLP